MARLGDVCTVQASTKQLDGDKFWLLNLDVVEQQTGNIVAFNYVSSDALNGSIIQFDSDVVLYSKLRPNLNKVVLPQVDGYATSEMLPLRPNRQKVDREYLAEFLRSDGFVAWAISKTAGAKMPRLGTKELLNVEIPLPTLGEQRNIARLFKQVRELISLRKQQLAKLDELVKARFVEMFGDPEDSTTGWERTTFSLVCIDMHQGINTVADKVEYVNSGFPIIQSKNITSGYLDLEDVRYVKESDYEYYRNKYNPKPSDLLVCNIGTIGKSLIVEEEVDFLIAWNLFLIKLNKELVNPIFIKVFIELLNQQNYFEKYMTGGTVKFVNKKTMGDISTPVPPIELQNQFATFVEQTDKSKLAIQQSLDKLETLKKALMQKYFG